MRKTFIAISILLIILAARNLAKVRNNILGESVESKGEIIGLIVPHHDLASGLIIDALSLIKQEGEYEKIIIIGPNHFYPESEMVVSTTSLGGALVDEEMVQALASVSPDVRIDNVIVEGEHSIGVPLKYIREIYPKAKLVPLVVSPHYNQDELSRIANFLTENNYRTLYVLAIDFSHNLGFDEAITKNEESIDAIKNFDIEKILTFEDDHLDSPVSTVLFLKIMEKLGANIWGTFYSTHGSILEGQPDLQGTSYVVGTFKKN